MKVPRKRWRMAGSTLALLAIAVLLGCNNDERSDSKARDSALSSELEKAAQGVGTPEDPAVFVKSGQRVYHTYGCKWLTRGKPGVQATTESEAKSQGYTPCEECMPPGT